MTRWSLAMVVLVGCGVTDEPLPPAELGEVCGADGAFRVLELQPGERLTEPPKALGERVVFRVGTYGPATDNGYAPVPEDVAVWMTGPCGESPVRRDPVQDLFSLERWPGVVLGHRRAEGELVTIVGGDEGYGHVAFSGLGPSYLYYTDHGLVTFVATGEEIGAALLHPFPDDPRVGTVTGGMLIDSIKVVDDDGHTYGNNISLLTDEAIALTTDGELVAVALADGARTIEQTGVRDFAVSPDGRWLLWEAVTGDDSTHVPGPVHLRDRSANVELSLGDLFLHATYDAFGGYDGGLFAVGLDAYGNGDVRVFALDDLAFVDVSVGRTPLHTFADGRVALGSLFYGGTDRYDPTDGSVTSLVGDGVPVWWGDDEFEVLGVAQCCLHGAKRTDEGPLYRVTVDGEVTRVADRVSRFGSRFEDGRRITGLGIGDDLLGELVLVDPDRGTSSQIDDRVFADTARMSSAFGDDTIVYSVDDGARTGVWIAKLPGG